ncbi:MAG: ABC transporter permease [Gammaproteobacteria bacterium]
MINWFRQIFSITLFSLRSLPQRLGSSVTALVGVAGVVAVLIGVLSIAQGVMSTMRSSVGDDNVIVLRSGANSELMSGFSGDEARIIREGPGLARDDDGVLASAELFVVINLPKRSTGTDVNVPLRGVDASAAKVRPGFRLLEGRMFGEGLNEVIVGVGAQREFVGLQLGDTIEIGAQRWPVVGVFATDGGIAESEIWVDARVLQARPEPSTASRTRSPPIRGSTSRCSGSPTTTPSSPPPSRT